MFRDRPFVYLPSATLFCETRAQYQSKGYCVPFCDSNFQTRHFPVFHITAVKNVVSLLFLVTVTDKYDERLKQRRHRLIVTMRALLVLASIFLELHLHLTGKHHHLLPSLSA